MNLSLYGNYDPVTVPLAPAPPGVTPNFVNPGNRTWEVYVTSAVCLAVTTLLVALRFYAKIFVIKQMTRDDCTIFDVLLFRNGNANFLIRCYIDRIRKKSIVINAILCSTLIVATIQVATIVYVSLSISCITIFRSLATLLKN